MTEAKVLLEALADFLKEDLQAELDGVNAYKNRIATNLLSQLLRESRLAPEKAEVETALANCLGDGLEKDLSVSSAQISQALRDGSLSVDDKLIEILRYRTMLQMAIDNPRYSGYREALERWPHLANQLAS